MKRIGLVFCILLLLLGSIPAPALASQMEDDLLGSVSAEYESNGDAGTISGGQGDLGGASYGAYQFASAYDVPLTFARWCITTQNHAYGNRLVAAYQADGNGFGTKFQAEWKAIAKEDPQGFLLLQRQYVKAKYYDPAVAALANNFNLQIQQYGIAFQNAVWSRTLQHGLGSFDNRTGFLGIMRVVDEGQPEGMLSLTEEQLITAIYEESGRVVSTGTNAMTISASGGNAWIVRQYELEGKYMKYFSGNSAAVQAGVYLRLRVNELTKLLEMLAEYGGYEGQAHLLTAQPVLTGQRLVLCDCNQINGWQGGPEMSLGVVEAGEETDGALLFLPLSLEADADATATLTFDAGVNLPHGQSLTMRLNLSDSVQQAALRIWLHHVTGETTKLSLDLSDRPAGWQTLSLPLPPALSWPVLAVSFDFTSLPREMMGKRIMLDDLSISLAPQELTKATVIADALNCRTAPGTGNPSLGQFLWGEQVAVVGPASPEGWYYCLGNSTKGTPLVGWCSGDYLTFEPITVSAGDVNGDQTLNALDALLILQFAVNKVNLSALQQTAADITQDGAINAVDALTVLQRAVNR